jgi:MinD-like ATPase involved in chromosome partitioning or flagellar assembly
MYVVTFYSYQGGVGRTTALVNVAADLALRGRKVLVVDLDLAKPSLSRFVPPDSGAPRPGVVDFISDYLHRGQSPPVEGCVYEAKIDVEADCCVRVMPAGRTDDDYWAALARIDWQDLYAVREGFLLLEDLKAQWRDVLQVDYVLIDPPAGITDTTGICTRQLADDVVFLINPNEGNQEGTGRVMKEVFEESIREGSRRIEIHLVTSKELDPEGEELPAAPRLGAILEPEWAISDTTGVGIMFELTAQFPHDPALLRGQQVVMTRRPGSRLAHQYRQLANAIILGNATQDREGAKAFLKELQRDPRLVIGDQDWGDPWDRWFDDTQKLEKLIEHFTAKRDEHDRLLDPVSARGDAEVLGQAASCYYLADSRVRAAEVLGLALAQSPNDPALLWQQASYRFKERNPLFVEDLMSLLDRAPPPARLPGDLLPLLKAQIREQQMPRLDTRPLRRDVLPLESVPGVDSYVVSAVRLLRKEAPERLAEALQRSRVQGLSEADRNRVLSEERSEEMFPDQDPEWLIRGRHFREVITRLGSSLQGAEASNFENAFHLAMAYWAVGREVEATQVSLEALKPWLAGGPEQLLDVFEPTAEHMVLLQMFALLAFRAGNVELADTLAFRLVGDLGEQFQGLRFFSYWRYRRVRFNLFRDDCRDLRQMIQQRLHNVPVSPPPFLAKSVSGVMGEPG